VQVWITKGPLDPAQFLSRVGASEDGAVLLFLGIVRDHNEGRRVLSIRYDAYVAMAEQVLTAVAREAAERLGTPRIAIAHRIGELRVGEVSTAIAVSSPHRAEAFDACRYSIEEIKQRLPVWKEEHYAEGDAKWLEGKIRPVPELLPGGAPRE